MALEGRRLTKRELGKAQTAARRLTKDIADRLITQLKDQRIYVTTITVPGRNHPYKRRMADKRYGIPECWGEEGKQT